MEEILRDWLVVLRVFGWDEICQEKAEAPFLPFFHEEEAFCLSLETPSLPVMVPHLAFRKIPKLSFLPSPLRQRYFCFFSVAYISVRIWGNIIQLNYVNTKAPFTSSNIYILKEKTHSNELPASNWWVFKLYDKKMGWGFFLTLNLCYTVISSLEPFVLLVASLFFLCFCAHRFSRSSVCTC